jgi:hemoglobin-like flavoprotein
MTTRQIELVKNSWNLVTPIAQEAGELFYKLLFEAAPGVKHLFKSDTATQSKKLMTMITVVVSKLDSLETILDDIKKLAARHDQYGARPEHYAVVGETLIKTLKIGLGERWNTETEEAWVAAYTILSGAMIANQKPMEKAA